MSGKQCWQWAHSDSVPKAEALETAVKRFSERWGVQPQRVLVRTGIELPVSMVDVEHVVWLQKNTFAFPVEVRDA